MTFINIYSRVVVCISIQQNIVQNRFWVCPKPTPMTVHTRCVSVCLCVRVRVHHNNHSTTMPSKRDALVAGQVR